jgi:hypothetical protein
MGSSEGVRWTFGPLGGMTSIWDFSETSYSYCTEIPQLDGGNTEEVIQSMHYHSWADSLPPFLFLYS